MPRYRAGLTNWEDVNEIRLQAGSAEHTLEIAPKAGGLGSSVSGGELLFLALATCYCNDIYREAAKRGIKVQKVEVAVEGDFDREGGPATNVVYSARVQADASEAEVLELMRYTDQVAEIHYTLRVLTPVELRSCEVIANE